MTADYETNGRHIMAGEADPQEGGRGCLTSCW